MYQTLAPSWFIQSPELAKEIIKKSWFDASKFITEPWQWVVPENMQDNPEDWAAPALPQWWWATDISNILKNITNPQTDLWNNWQWSPFNPNR